MTEREHGRLTRLQDELGQTLMLLESPRLSLETRLVLEALRTDLERQIAVLQSPKEPA